MRILFVSSEVMPFSKTGGLADVSQALPAALKRSGVEVVIATPRYSQIDVATHELRRKRHRLGVPVKGKIVHGGLLEGATPEGVPVLFVDQSAYFDRPGIYGENGKDYPDNDERFTFFSRAVLEACLLTGFSPDVIHCNDWQSGPVAPLLQHDYRDKRELNRTGTVFSIHNLGYQGLFPPTAMMSLGLDWTLFTPSTLEFFGKVSFIKGGLVFADRLTTVSKKYAAEIQTADYGFGLHGVLSERTQELRGIVNGVDYQVWDPANDRHIAANYTADDFSGKVVCKADLQQRMGLEVAPESPLLGCVSRLTSQKGIDLIIEAMPLLLKAGCQFAILGEGTPDIEKQLADLSQNHPRQVAFQAGFSEDLAHRIEAGADIYLMPSRYEPCGLNQIYSLRYGTIPVVRATGGLEDTIDDDAEGDGCGFKFDKASSQELAGAVDRALKAFSDRATWRRLMETAMSLDFSWDLPARRYESVYRDVIALRR